MTALSICLCRRPFSTCARSRPPKEEPLQHIMIRILTPIMLKADRHSKAQVDPHTMSDPRPQGRHDRIIIRITIKPQGQLTVGIEIQEIHADSCFVVWGEYWLLIGIIGSHAVRGRAPL